MARLLEDSLRTLQQLQQDHGLSSVENISSIIGDISQIILNETSGKDNDYCCSLLFDKEIGIVSFLKAVVVREELQNCKTALLDLLSAFLQKVDKKIKCYLLDIKEACVSLFFRDRFAKVKNAAIPVLIKVLELSVDSQMDEELKIEDLIKKFFMELSKSSSKLQASVKGNILNLLGVLSEVYPEKMIMYSDRLVGLYVSALKMEMSSKTREPQLTVIAGCLEGLNCYLVNFTQSADEGSKYAYDIFRYARMAIDPGIKHTRYAVPEAGLRLFARHGAQFSEYLVDDYEGMYEKLKYWSHHQNRDVMHLGMSALESFLQQLSEILVSRAKEGQKEGAVFKFFMKQFHEIMRDQQASDKQISLAIRGYGLLAAPCKIFTSEADVQYMMNEMISKSEHQFLGQPGDVLDRLYAFPSYLDALANIIKHVDKVSDTHASSLEHLLVFLFENVPHINHKMHFACQKAILHVLLSLMSKGITFQQVLSDFVYQSLIRICSHPILLEQDQTASEMGEDETSVNKKNISYKDYLELWAGMLDSPRIKDFAALDISLADRHKLTEALYDELLTSILKIIRKLDLTSTDVENTPQAVKTDEGNEDKEGMSADPVHGLQANRPKDFQILINLVDLCRNLLPNHHYELFIRWMFTFCNTVIYLSTKNPLVSGFYKLLAIAMKIASKLEYFKEVSPTNPVKGEPMETEESDTRGLGQKHTCFQLVKKFSREVLVRMKQYRDDLLASCLSLILVLPKEIICDQLVDVVPAIQITFSLGLSYLPLAKTGLEALQYWSQHLPDHIISPHYKDILPFLDNYLKTADQNLMESAIIVPTSRSSHEKKKLSTRIIKGYKKKEENTDYESPLTVIKQQILHFLGSIGGSVNHTLLAHSDGEVSRKAVAWDTHQHLRFDMPFTDMKPTIYLDPFIPRVVELATTSSDRQTKVAACELLHSFVIYSLGRGAQQPGDRSKQYPMERLYRKLFPAIFQLACDVELISRQLFEVLTLQLIHWFTNNKMAESGETMALLDTIFDGLIQPTNTALRDFSAKCLQEFMKWSIKQTSRKVVDQSPVNAKSVLKRIFSFALHPSAFKRLGAVLAFNNIYMVFREENSLVDRFTFQILVHFVESLAIAHSDEKSLGTLSQCVIALTHLEKIISKRSDPLSKESKVREEPREWSKKTLDIAVRWLMRQCGRPQTECRHTCMKLVTQLAPLVHGVKSTQNYFQIFLNKEGSSHFISRFEGGIQATSGQYGLCSCPTLNQISDTFSLSVTVHWFHMLLASLDCYTWVFGEDLLSPVEMWSDTGKHKSKIFESVQYFLENLALVGIEDAAKVFTKHSSDFFTPRETEEFNREKCTVVVRLWNFLTLMLGRYPKEALTVIPDKLWSIQLWELLSRCVVHPSDVGFNVGDVEVMANLPGQMENALKVLTNNLLPQHTKKLKEILLHYLKGDRDVFALLPLSLTNPGTDFFTITQLISGYEQLHKVGLLTGSFQEHGNSQKLAQNLFDSVYMEIVVDKMKNQTALTLTPTALAAAKHMLELAFQLNLPADVLVNSLLDKKMVIGVWQGTEQCHGDIFFAQFRPVIASQIARTSDSVVPLLVKRTATDSGRVTSILVSVIDYIVRDKKLRKIHGEQMVSVILQHWKQLTSQLKSASTDLRSCCLLLLTKLLLLDSKVASNTKHPTYPDLFETYQSMLTDTYSSLTFKHRILDLLPFFAMVEEPYISKLKSSLDIFISQHFPLKSSEFPKDSQRFNEYITAIDKLLSAMELSCNLVLLEVVISISCHESRHVHHEAFQKSFMKFIKRLPADRQKLALDVPFSIFMKESSFPAEIRKTTLEQVCLPMLRFANKSALIEFFLDHIEVIMKTLEANRSAQSDFEHHLVSKSCCFQLLEVMYSRLTKDEVNSKNSIINQKYCCGQVQTGKEMTMKITKCAHEGKSEDTRGETTLLEERRQYHCAAYCLLIAVISCTQTDVKFYNGFLFSDKEAKGQFLLDNIIDKNRHWEFPVELQAALERKKKFVSIRSEVKQQRVENEEDWSSSSSLHLASVYLADSSLSEDASKYDFSISSSAESLANKKQTDISASPDEDKDTQMVVDGNFIELEMDELNQHECMASLVALLKHMQKNSITPLPPEGSLSNEMPAWMSYLHKKMTNSLCHNNIKLFIAKLIINTAEIFQPYGQFWLLPLTQLIISGPLSSGRISYFTMDLIVTMLSWHKTAVPQDAAEERAVASRLVEFLMNHIYHETRFVFRNNLEMVKTLLECWKDRIEIPYRIIYKHLKESSDKKSRESSVGIQLMGVVMACKFPPYGPDAPVDQERFLSVIADSMTGHYQEVYAASAEVVGLIFKYLAEKEITEGTFHDHVYSLISNMHQAKPSNFIVCVHKMSQHYPCIAHRFLNKLLFMLPKMFSQFRSQCLEVIHRCIDRIENVFVELKSKGLMNFITHRDESTQLVALQIVKTISAKLNASELLSLIPAVTGISQHPSVNCRRIMYDILMWIYDNYRELESDDGHKIMQLTKEALLKGLGDEDLHCRLLVQNFWSSSTRLPVNTLDRMVAMLEAMYSPSTEQQYLSYATNLLLEMTSKSPDYQKDIFEHPLSECKFQDYSVQSSWRQHHAVMTPLFAVTQTSQSLSTADSMDGRVRATQDVNQFTQTVEGAPFNWLTQSSLDTYAENVSFGPSESQSSLLFTMGSVVKSQPNMKAGSRFGQRLARPKAGTSADSASNKEESTKEDEIWHLKRRFLKDHDAKKLYFAKRMSRLKTLQEKRKKEQQLRRESQVTMYRKYRTGDLPDIQIKFSYLIAPLQALAQRDSTIAKMLFGSIFKAVFAEMDEVKTEHEVGECIKQINNSIDSILTLSNQYFPPFFACLMDILHDLRSKLKVDPANLVSSALVSNLQALGITVIEEQLIQCDAADTINPAKRRRGKSISVSTEVGLWIELARLYKSVSEYDVIQGIFSGKIKTKDITARALEFEAKGDYLAALTLYDEALSCNNWDDGDPLDAETDLWDDCRMECLDRLCRWQALEDVSVSGTDSSGQANLTRVWEDNFALEHYLPALIRSKLKLLLKGDNQQSLLTFIDEALSDTEKKTILESQFSEELALMFLWQENYDRSRHYTSMAVQRFIQNWGNTDSLMMTSRYTQLQRLQPLHELQEFLEFWAHQENFSTLMPAKRLVECWEKRSPHLLLDSVEVWDDVVTNRNVYLDKITSRLEQEDDSVFEETKIRQKLAMAESAREQNNIHLTLQILKETLMECKSLESPSLLIEWRHVYASTHHKKAESQAGQWTDELFNSVLTTLEQLDKHCIEVLHEHGDLGRRHCVLKGQAYALLAKHIQNPESIASLSSKTKDKLKRVCSGTDTLSPQQVTEQLVQKGYDEIKGSLAYFGGRDTQRSKFGVGDAHLAVAQYCDVFLRMKEQDDANLNSAVLEKFPQAVIVCMLRAMKFGSAEARERYPRLLQLVEYYPDTMADFRKESSEIPSWMFILWISQMMALLDKQEAPAVQEILYSLAVDYPQAVVYAFRISSESFQFGSSTQDKRNREAVAKIMAQLTDEHCPLVSRFISALDQFVQPDMLFKDWTDEMKKLLHSGNKEKIKKNYSDLYRRLVDCDKENPDTLTSQSPAATFGEFRKKFAQIFKKDFDTKFGVDGEKLAVMSEKTFQNIVADIMKKMNEHNKPRGQLLTPTSLKKYSQWMADFNSNREGRDLEIPGQYDGQSKPMPEYHVKIAGFDNNIKVMSSLRKPKRLTIRGNDEKDYNYLVKCGEDLRLDQRIEQLFVIMNKIMANDPACRLRKLVLKTYQVIPMTTRLGLIEWITNTNPLKEFLFSAFTEQERNHYNSQQGPKQQHQKWIQRFSDNKKDVVHLYSQVYLKYNKSETVKEFQLKENKIPWDLSRRAFYSMSTSPEAFHVLRSEFARSHAVICICHYLLGIGDRHLSNFMVNLKTGQMVGIDFGHAFGSATQFLPVPELMPFRLTRQIVNITLPLQVKGLFESTMIHVLQALRNNSSLLMNTMDIFVKEPSLDWLQFAEKQKAMEKQPEDADDDFAWYPKQKIQFAQRKLNGDNPACITKDELELGQSRKPAFRSFQAVAAGDKDSPRAKLPDSGLTVEQQVEALVDQSTDPNLLGRVYVGWESWV